LAHLISRQTVISNSDSH